MSRTPRFRIRWSAALLAAGLTCPTGAARAQTRLPPPEPARAPDNRPPVPPGLPTTPDNVHLPTEGEVKLGRDTAADVEKVYKVVTSGPYYERLQRVAADVVRAIQRQDVVAEYRRVYQLPRSGDRSRRVPFEFTFKLVESTELVNAFSLAGGPVYVTRGLMDYATSDHELAAVLSHECTHVVFHHVEQLIRKQRKVNSAQIWGLLATVIAGVAGGGAAAGVAGNVLMGAQLVSIATLTGYGRELETEADRIAVMAMTGTPYNPVGMLTFMQKLARDDKLRGNPDYGIFQSHPFPNERVAALKSMLEKRGHRLDSGHLREVSGSFRVQMAPIHWNGRAATELRLNGSLLFIVVAPEGEMPPAERARKIARQIETVFAENLSYNDVRRSDDKSVLSLKGIPVIRVYPEDAAVMGSAAAVTERAANAINRSLIKEQLGLPG